MTGRLQKDEWVELYKNGGAGRLAGACGSCETDCGACNVERSANHMRRAGDWPEITDPAAIVADTVEQWLNGEPPTVTRAQDILAAAAGHMQARAATYDSQDGERSMGDTVTAFNAITGRALTESEGWLMMALLKMVRSQQRDEPHRDSLEDLVAYGALFAESRIAGR